MEYECTKRKGDEVFISPEKWFDILDKYTGIRGVQSGNSSLWIFRLKGSDNIWLHYMKKKDPETNCDAGFDTFKNNRLNNNNNNNGFTYWFSEDELESYEVPIEEYAEIFDIDDIIDSI